MAGGTADKENSREIVYIVHIRIIRAPDVKRMEVVREAEDGRNSSSSFSMTKTQLGLFVASSSIT